MILASFWGLAFLSYATILNSKRPADGRRCDTNCLAELTHRVADARATLIDIWQRSRVGETDMLLRSEVFARHAGDLGFFEIGL